MPSPDGTGRWRMVVSGLQGFPSPLGTLREREEGQLVAKWVQLGLARDRPAISKKLCELSLASSLSHLQLHAFRLDLVGHVVPRSLDLAWHKWYSYPVDS